jgi:TetR/AcrR family transcriptional regulator, acrAB operon repressor
MRRTKEDAQQTRQRIITAARDVFARRGVSRTSLDQIARAAGVTRGAIYWHFANKTELFYAMREQVSLPMVDRIGLALEGRDAGDPLLAIERLLQDILDTIVHDQCARQTFHIIAFKCEYVSELERELRQQAKGHGRLYAKLADAYRRARRAGGLRADVKPELAALETCAFLSGLVRLWLLDEDSKLVRRSASNLIAAHVAGRRPETAETAGLRDARVG